MSVLERTSNVKYYSNEMTDVFLHLLKVSKETNADVTLNQIKICAENSNVCVNIFQQALKNIKSIVNELPKNIVSKRDYLTIEAMVTGNKRARTANKFMAHIVAGIKNFKSINCLLEPSDLNYSKYQKQRNTSKSTYKCEKCFCAFTFKTALKGHSRIHTQIKKLRCCKQLFTTSNSFAIHLLIHSRLKPIVCNLCNRTFCTYARRNIHLKSQQHLYKNKESEIIEAKSPVQEPILISDGEYPVSKNGKPSSHAEYIESASLVKSYEVQSVPPLAEKLTSESERNIPNSKQKMSPKLNLDIYNTQNGIVEEAIIIHNHQDFRKTQRNETTPSKTEFGLRQKSTSQDKAKIQSSKDISGCVQQAKIPRKMNNLVKKIPLQRLFTCKRRQQDHENEKNYCLLCRTSFASSEVLETHMRLHSDLDQLFNSDSRSKATPRHKAASRQKQHQLRKEPNHNFKCFSCPYSSSDQECLQTHALTHTREQSYSCNECNLTFNHVSKLERHRCIHDCEKSYICSICHKSFNSSIDCIKHDMDNCSGLKPYGLSTSQKSFTQNIDKRNHEKVHNGRKSYMCPYCNNLFSGSSDLKKHIIRMHTRLFPHQCLLCGKGFVRPAELKVHMKNRH